VPPAVPTPVTASIGLVPTVHNGVRSIPGKAVQLPVLAVSQALTAADKVRREYDDLAERGERLVARLRGTSFDELEDRVEDLVERTPFAGAYDKVEDALEDAGDKVRSIGSRTAKAGSKTAEKTVEKAGSLADDLQGELALPEAEEPKGAPTPKATQPDSTRVDTAATPDVVALVEQVADEVTGGGATPLPSHAELPLPDYDHMTLGSLRGRLRSLALEELVVLRDYEKAKADRLPVVTMLDNRIAKLASDAAAQPTGNASDAPAPEQLAAAKAPAKKGKVSKPAEAKNAPSPPHGKVRLT
jgi:hypothetical protein